MVGIGEPNLSINLYREGKLIDHLLYYAHPKREELRYRVLDYLSDNDGAMLSLQGVGRWKKDAKIKEFFKQRKIPISGTVNEFTHEASLPKVNVEIFVDTIFLKNGVKNDEKIKMSELKSGIARSLKHSLGWRLKRLMYRYYKDVFKLKTDYYNYDDELIHAETIFYNYENGFVGIVMSNGEKYWLYEE